MPWEDWVGKTQGTQVSVLDMFFEMPIELLIEDLKIKSVWNLGERSEIEDIFLKVISIYNRKFLIELWEKEF